MISLVLTVSSHNLYCADRKPGFSTLVRRSRLVGVLFWIVVLMLVFTVFFEFFSIVERRIAHWARELIRHTLMKRFNTY
jgi:hypothetical protein